MNSIPRTSLVVMVLRNEPNTWNLINRGTNLKWRNNVKFGRWAHGAVLRRKEPMLMLWCRRWREYTSSINVVVGVVLCR